MANRYWARKDSCENIPSTCASQISDLILSQRTDKNEVDGMSLKEDTLSIIGTSAINVIHFWTVFSRVLFFPLHLSLSFSFYLIAIFLDRYTINLRGLSFTIMLTFYFCSSRIFDISWKIWSNIKFIAKLLREFRSRKLYLMNENFFSRKLIIS